ncbi:MAG: hypothetical protein JNL29_01230 [Nitrospira sp.]|nr:hypothetical protein [Nitrospira sp.]
MPHPVRKQGGLLGNGFSRLSDVSPFDMFTIMSPVEKGRTHRAVEAT